MNTNNRYSGQDHNKIEIINPKVVNRENNMRRELILNALGKCQSFFDRLFPGDTDREVDKWRQKLIAQEGQQMIENSSMLHEFKTKAFREMANEALAHGSKSGRKKFAETFAVELKELTEVISNESLKLTRSYDEQICKVALIESDFARKKQLEIMERTFDKALDMLWLPYEQFINIPNTLIG